ncbi:MAG: DUF123 domain-containing protein, partial [Gemmatimonadales bacterium]|nr:DUF123 domain-containing protein [Gemmatimonadales bacterium]NIN11314.1 DUF123 domain-containing protein [Gemmatimonadales bacterium]NIN49913.1 DUF123 domain-containing protein [Gemmatimonadales bacterium]NIP07377.1 DUF123 domain-containing protein [Gemmatimonadales bacterium]NIR03072.1 DUF123 domain-containing protein [Gemmatimonadales bacterium]
RARRHWHVDHLRGVTTPVAVWFADDEVRREHDWAQAISQTRVAQTTIPRFGSSDCGCQSHLFYLPSLPSWRWLRRHCAGVVHTLAIPVQLRKAE